MTPLIKVCGMRDPANIAAVAALRPDLLGFIFYEGSPRFAGSLDPRALDALPDTIRRVGVFVDASPKDVLSRAQAYGLHLLQLHGDEPPEACAALRRRYPVVKAFGIATAADLDRTSAYEGCCDYFLFDAKTPARGGSGLAFDHRLLEGYRGRTPFFLSGGIGPQQARTLLPLPALCCGVDLNSRFETAPGFKDAALLREFIAALRRPRQA